MLICLRRPGGFFEKPPPGPLKNFWLGERMSVIINDFEVVVEPTTGAEAKEAGPKGTSGPALTPQDIRDILRRQAERSARVRAD